MNHGSIVQPRQLDHFHYRQGGKCISPVELGRQSLGDSDTHTAGHGSHGAVPERQPLARDQDGKLDARGAAQIWRRAPAARALYVERVDALGHRAAEDWQPSAHAAYPGRKAGGSSGVYCTACDVSSVGAAVVSQTRGIHARVAALQPEELEINCGNVDQLVLGDFLGQGFWREVYRANWKGREVAVKVVKEHLLNRTDIVTRHVEEVAAIFPVRNAPNIVSLVGWCNSTVVVDYVPKKLDEMLYESNEVISVRRALELALDAARGLAQLHSAAGGPFAHTDIQTRQFLVDIDGKLLLNDFNRIKYAGPRLAHGKPTKEKCTFSTAVAKGKWRSPEEYKHVELDEKLDVYSLSLVLWSLRSREKPYGNLSREKVYKKIPQGIRPPVSAMGGFPNEMQQLIVRAWDADPAKRPSAAELATSIEKILEKYEFES